MIKKTMLPIFNTNIFLHDEPIRKIFKKKYLSKMNKQPAIELNH